MKTIKSILYGLAIIGGLIALSGFIHAQVTTVQAQSVSGSRPGRSNLERGGGKAIFYSDPGWPNLWLDSSESLFDL